MGNPRYVTTHGKRLKILFPKQMIQRLQAVNTPENLLNQIGF